jgi:hypothetical protein
MSDILMFTSPAPTWLGYTILSFYIIGFFFCLFIRSVIEETPLKKASNPVRYGVLFLIWVVSPAVIIGLFTLTFKILFKNGNRNK